MLTHSRMLTHSPFSLSHDTPRTSHAHHPHSLRSEGGGEGGVRVGGFPWGVGSRARGAQGSFWPPTTSGLVLRVRGQGEYVCEGFELGEEAVDCVRVVQHVPARHHPGKTRQPPHTHNASAIRPRSNGSNRFKFPCPPPHIPQIVTLLPRNTVPATHRTSHPPIGSPTHRTDTLLHHNTPTRSFRSSGAVPLMPNLETGRATPSLRHSKVHARRKI